MTWVCRLDHRPDHGSDHGLDHGSDHRSDHRSWIGSWKIKLEKTFIDPKTPCSQFHGCSEECCVVSPWTKANWRHVSFQKSKCCISQKNARQSAVAS